MIVKSNLGLNRMTKLAHARAEEADIKQTTELDFEMEAYLKKKKEDEIRLRLDEFAKELAQVSKTRKEI
tara:strand:+ start:240 stop:446 length:207 start_codon:yes stop_codon:yes gene_type:complete